MLTPHISVYSALIMLASLRLGINRRSPSVSLRGESTGRLTDDDDDADEEADVRSPSIESTFEDSDKHIHSTGDTTDYEEFSFDHMKEFSKLAVAFGVELAGHQGK
jgi:hypothetical protein